MKKSTSLLLLGLLLFGLIVGGSIAGPTGVHSDRKVLAFALQDLSGQLHNLGNNDEQRIRVFVFLGTDCPIPRANIPALNRLYARVVGRGSGVGFYGVEFYGVVADTSVTRKAAAQFAHEYQVSFPILFDSSGLITAVLRPSRVPEAFVLDRDGLQIYQGAINNSWISLERRRPIVEHEYLADAISAAVEGRAPAVPKTESVGCFLESPVAESSGREVTFCRDIAPIIESRCMSCHRDGQVAPFSLTNFDQVSDHARQIALVTQNRIMPPWFPAPGQDSFVDDRSLTDREVQLIGAWVKAGRPKGNLKDLPTPPQFETGWQLGKPDMIVKMPRPFHVPADGPDILQNMVIPLNNTQDALVSAIEFHPGNRKVDHHAVLFVDSSGQARKLESQTAEPGYSNSSGLGFIPSGALGGWSVGNTARRLPNGMGRYLKKESDLVVQMHYHPSGKPETDQSEVGIYFVKEPFERTLLKPRKVVGSIWISNYEMDIPAGESQYVKTAEYTLPKDVVMVGVVPHMHLLGKSMTVTAKLPDRTQRTLVEVRNWNYNWQDEYYFQRPFSLPAGTQIVVRAVYDNSSTNPANPNDPPKRVTWGDGTLNEMLFCFFLITSDRIEDLINVIGDNVRHDLAQPRKVMGGG